MPATCDTVSLAAGWRITNAAAIAFIQICVAIDGAVNSATANRAPTPCWARQTGRVTNVTGDNGATSAAILSTGETALDDTLSGGSGE